MHRPRACLCSGQPASAASAQGEQTPERRLGSECARAALLLLSLFPNSFPSSCSGTRESSDVRPRIAEHFRDAVP